MGSKCCEAGRGCRPGVSRVQADNRSSKTRWVRLGPTGESVAIRTLSTERVALGKGEHSMVTPPRFFRRSHKSEFFCKMIIFLNFKLRIY